MARRKVSNPLALAVLALLNERPMHPYEMSTTLRERHKEESIKLNFGSLYTVVESLVRVGYIVATHTVREGRRPERTVYAITDPGQVELYDWMAELVSTPAKEYLQFEAALSLLPVLAPAEALRLLTERRLRLIKTIESARATEAMVAREGLPRLFHLENDYLATLHRAELAFVEDLIDAIAHRTLDGIELWEVFHSDPADPESTAARIAAVKQEFTDGRWAEVAPVIMRELEAMATTEWPAATTESSEPRAESSEPRADASTSAAERPEPGGRRPAAATEKSGTPAENSESTAGNSNNALRRSR